MQTAAREELLSRLADLQPAEFEAAALEVFRYQAAFNPLYRRFIDLLGIRPEAINSVGEIPFLPISLFKKYDIQTGNWSPEMVFTSSSTSGQSPSRHLVRNLAVYLENARQGFARAYGDPSEWCILALLPAYLERTGSSLVAMADYFIRLSRFPQSGFFLNDLAELARRLEQCRRTGQPTLLLGVSFALLDFAETYPMDLRGVTVMETGGMKGRRREITRAALHNALSCAFQVSGIHSEYGMTELFSQAYAQPAKDHASVFVPGPLLRVLTFELNDPFCPAASGRTGVMHAIDLANLDTVSFIATEDLGKCYSDGTFEVLGRLDAAEWRGCNLMVE